MKCCSWKCRACTVCPTAFSLIHRPRQLALPSRKIVESINAEGTLFLKSSNLSLQQALTLEQSCHRAAKLCNVTFDCHISLDAWLQECSYHCSGRVCYTLEVPPVHCRTGDCTPKRPEELLCLTFTLTYSSSSSDSVLHFKLFGSRRACICSYKRVPITHLRHLACKNHRQSCTQRNASAASSLFSGCGRSTILA